MDSLMALGDPDRLAIVECLLNMDAPKGKPRQLTNADLTAQLPSLGGTLSKRLDKLREAGLVVNSPGPRKDQPLLGLRQPAKLLVLLECAAELDAAIGDEIALLGRLEADAKAERARRISALREARR